MKFTQKIGFILLGIFLIIWGLTYIIDFRLSITYILAGLAIAAGIFILIDR